MYALYLSKEWIYAIAGSLMGVSIAFLLLVAAFRARIGSLSKRYETSVGEAKRRIKELESALSETRESLERERLVCARLRGKEEELRKIERKIEEGEEALEEGRRRNLGLEKELSALKIRLEEERRQSRARLEELRNARESLHREFKALAEGILAENGRKFGELSKEKVEEVLKPLGEQVREFRQRIDRVHVEESKEMATLMQEIRTLKELNLKIGDEATKLTRALKGESKTRGIWGEMVLERVLEASGLRRGEEYERERSFRAQEGHRYRPDAIVHLPGGRDIVVDAKTPLLEYERWVNASDESSRRVHARRHLEVLRRHIEELSAKNYEKLPGVESLDFVLMFLPIEGALILALQEDSGLYERAFERRIVLVSPTTLLVALKAVENTWRRERQNRNAMEIASRAGALYDKFVGFAEELEKLGRQLNTAQKSYDTAWNRLVDGRGNLVRQIEELRELGAGGSKTLPESLRVAASDCEGSRQKEDEFHGPNPSQKIARNPRS